MSARDRASKNLVGVDEVAEPDMTRTYLATGGAAAALLLALWVGVPMYKRAKADAMVDEMCAKDGGIKTYETVKLPKSKFDKYGNFLIPTEPRPGAEYYLKIESRWLVPYSGEGYISMSRQSYQIYRVSDNKLLGEAVSYLRRGGDPISLAHPSSYRCPEDVGVEKHVFLAD